MSIREFHRLLFFAICIMSAIAYANDSLAAECMDIVANDSAIINATEFDLCPPSDESLTLDQYIEVGIPAHDRIWSGEDMTRAANILTEIAQNDPGHLPRYQSPNSGEAFDRLIADENLDLYRNRSLPLEMRFYDALNYIESSNQVFNIYLAAFNQRAVGDSELVDMSGSLLRMSVVMLQLVNELLPLLDKEDPTYPVRMNGLEQMKSGLASVVAGGIQTLTESHAFRTSELKRLIGYMENTFPDIFPELSASSRTESMIRLRSFLDDTKMQHLNPELSQLVVTMENVIETE
ncbi:MAG: hypothetical protein AAGA80_12375 [Cyanobacteria bacterium P01_F01_bin.143]